MSTFVTKSKKNLRENLTELRTPQGVAGRNILAAETKAQAFDLTGSGRKNIIHNGAMTISQQYQDATHLVDGWAVMGVDRFRCSVRPSTGTFNAEQNNITGIHPAGFSKSLLLTQQSVTTEAANDYYNLLTKIEGNDVAHLGLGSEHAKTVTVSFWVRSSITGRYAFGMQNEAGGSVRQSYVTDYNIDAPNAWEYKTFVIPLSQTGTWYNDNQAGLQLNWNFGRGTAYQTTNLNIWETNVNALSHTGTVDWIGNSGATWELTGVQMEIGEAATPFEHRSYGEELRLCQRYFTMLAEGANRGGSSHVIGTMHKWNSTNTFIFTDLPTEMRDGNNQSVVKSTGSADFSFKSAGYTSTGNDITLDGDSSARSIRLNSAVTNSNWPLGCSGWVRINTNDGFIAISNEM